MGVKKTTTDIYDIVAANIKKFKMASGMIQKQLVLKTSYTPEYIRRVESLKRKGGFSLSVVYVIAKVLGRFFCELQTLI